MMKRNVAMIIIYIIIMLCVFRDVAANSEPFERHADGLFDRDVGLLFENGPDDHVRSRFGEAEHHQGRRRFVVDGVAVAGDGQRTGVAVEQGREFAAQLDDDLLQSQPLDVLEQDGVFGGDDALQFARRIGRENHACRVAAHARYADELAEQFALGLRREAEKELRVLAHDEMGEELHLAPAFDFRIGLQRNMEQVAHSAGFDDGVGGRQFGELPLDIFVHSFREIV